LQPLMQRMTSRLQEVLAGADGQTGPVWLDIELVGRALLHRVRLFDPVAGPGSPARTMLEQIEKRLPASSADPARRAAEISLRALVHTAGEYSDSVHLA